MGEDGCKWSQGPELVRFLYEKAWQEEEYFLHEMDRRLAVFAGLLPAMIAATIAGAFQASDWWHFLILIGGPVLTFAIAKTAEDSTRRSYRRVLEAIALRAKCEFDLGLTSERAPAGPETRWFETESFAMPRYLLSRSGVGASRGVSVHREPLAADVERLGAPGRFSSGDEFVDHHLDSGLRSDYRGFFRTVQTVALALGIGFLFLTLMTAFPP